MSSSEQTSPTETNGGGGDGITGTGNESPTPNYAMRGRFNVTRTRHIARAGVPLVSEDGTPAVSPCDPPFTSTPPAMASDSVIGGGGVAAATIPAGATATRRSHEHGSENGNRSSTCDSHNRTAAPMGTPPLAPSRPPVMRSSSGSRGPTPPTQGTPPLAPRTTPVPLITPRYQKKSCTQRSMELTDSFMERSGNAGQLLRQHATESLTVTNGPQQYQQEVHFHTYGVYRHGRHQIHSRSVGYSSDGDLVMIREDYSEPSDVDNGVTRVHTVISDATVLDPTARRPLTDTEMASKRKLHLRRPRYKKYPGIYAPRSKKLRNRLMNDCFLHDQALRILSLARERREDGLDDDAPPPPKPSFQDLPLSVLRAFDLSDEAQERELERLGAVQTTPGARPRPVKNPDAAETRFQKLNTRLRGELQHALNSEFLTAQIEDLEVCFSVFLTGPSTAESLVFRFRDGYGRLVCHGVAAYYELVSDSRFAADGQTKLTFVMLPKSRRTGARGANLPSAPLLHVLRGNRGNAPARHPLSATNSPQQGPQPSPSMGGAPSPSTAATTAGGGSGAETNSGVSVDIMPPLDLNVNADLSLPPPLATADESDGNGCAGLPAMRLPHAVVSSTSDEDEVGTAYRRGKSSCGPESLVNPTVFSTIEGKLLKADDVPPLYVPCLKLKQLELVAECIATQAAVSTGAATEAVDSVSEPSENEKQDDSSDSNANGPE